MEKVPTSEEIDMVKSRTALPWHRANSTSVPVYHASRTAVFVSTAKRTALFPEGQPEVDFVEEHPGTNSASTADAVTAAAPPGLASFFSGRMLGRV